MIAPHDALVVAAALLLPGTAFIAGRVAFTTWRTTRRRRARGAWRVINQLRPLAGKDAYS